MDFIRTYLIRFQHCDPAGIVFFPRYFTLFNDHVEDWFDEALGADFAVLHRDRRLGVPTVHIECDFANPTRQGERLDFSLGIERIGRSSLHLRREARCGNDVRVRMKQVLACIDLDGGGALPWPDDLREAMSPFLTEEPTR